MKFIISIGLLLCTSSILSQFLTFNPNVWNLTYSEEFNNSYGAEWEYLDPNQPWGNQVFSGLSKYVNFGTEGSRTYLKLNAYVENINGALTNVSGGIHIPDKIWDNILNQTIFNPNNNFYYGYYEIEARIKKGSQSMQNNGLWPAFWLSHGESDLVNNNFWYEEIDIFEPGACYVRDQTSVVHLWTYENSYTTNIWYGDGHEGSRSVDMFSWHKYGLLWLPDRIVFFYDGAPFHTCSQHVPFHEKPHLFIDLQLDDNGCMSPLNNADQYLGSFEVNYFKYYTRKSCSPSITETIGNNYDFSAWLNTPNTIRQYIVFKNTTIPNNTTIQTFSSEMTLMSNFTVPLGSEFEVNIAPCE